MKKNLYFVQLPPPIHGVTTINKFIYESKKINENFQTDLIEIRYSDNLSQLQKFTFGKIIKHFVIAGKLLQKLITFKPNYVYFTIVPTGVGFYKDLLFLWLMKLSSATPVLHLHGKGIAEKVENKLIKRIYEWAFSKSIIIHLSKRLLDKELGRLHLKNTKKCFVENGVEEIKTDFIESSKNKDVVNILFLSNLFESKGVFVALEAFRLLPLEKENVVLHLVGGMSSKEMEEKINKIIAKNNLPVIIHGALFGDKKYKILEIADIFIHPTLNDAFPLVLLEAMQFKLPIISTYQGAIPDIIDDGQTGFLVKENDVVVLSEKISY